MKYRNSAAIKTVMNLLRKICHLTDWRPQDIQSELFIKWWCVCQTVGGQSFACRATDVWTLPAWTINVSLSSCMLPRRDRTQSNAVNNIFPSNFHIFLRTSVSNCSTGTVVVKHKIPGACYAKKEKVFTVNNDCFNSLWGTRTHGSF